MLINGDCIIEMDKLIEKGYVFDAIITDPPFNLVEKQGGSIHLFRQSKKTGADTITEDSMKFDTGFNQTLWIEKAMKLLKKGGNIIIFNDWENMAKIAGELRKNKINVKSLNHWQKTNPLPSEWRRRFVSGREYFIYGSKKGAIHTFNTEKVHHGDFIMGLTPGGEKKHGKHPNQKPIKLMEEIIKITTNEGDKILDPFMGSGTTGIASLKLNRNFCGIELDKKYFNIAKNRWQTI